MKNKLNIRNFLALAIFVLAGSLAVTVVRNFRGPAPERMLSSIPRNVDLALKKVHYTETRDGVRRWTLVADSAAHDMGDGIAHIKNIRMTFYDADGKGAVTLTARSGELKSAAHEMEARGHVVVKSARGYTVYTDQLRYREDDRTIRTAAPVRLVSTTMVVRGRGMRFDVRHHTIQLLSGIRGRVESADKGKEDG
jgi:LPS export ABC transporter protein LptC